MAISSSPPDVHPNLKSELFQSFSSPFRQIDPTNFTSVSIESKLTKGPVPLSGLVRLRTVGPLQKLGRPESGSIRISPNPPSGYPT